MISRAYLATKMSWASRRQTSRPEDMAYCLLGLFDVNMPLFYGEGTEKAFTRLQLEIIRSKPNDETIYAWILNSTQSDLSLKKQGILAPNPTCFSSSAVVVPITMEDRSRAAPTMANGKLYFWMGRYWVVEESSPEASIISTTLNCRMQDGKDSLVMRLGYFGQNTWMRIKCDKFYTCRDIEESNRVKVTIGQGVFVTQDLSSVDQLATLTTQVHLVKNFQRSKWALPFDLLKATTDFNTYFFFNKSAVAPTAS